MIMVNSLCLRTLHDNVQTNMPIEHYSSHDNVKTNVTVNSSSYDYIVYYT